MLASGFKLSDLLPIVIFIAAGLFGVLNKYLEKKQLEAKENAKLDRRRGDADLSEDEQLPVVEIKQPSARPIKPAMYRQSLPKPAVGRVVQSPPKIQQQQVQPQRFSSAAKSRTITQPPPAAVSKKASPAQQKLAGRVTENVIFAILKKPENLRAAFILSDVLGKPTALKEE